MNAKENNYQLLNIEPTQKNADTYDTNQNMLYNRGNIMIHDSEYSDPDISGILENDDEDDDENSIIEIPMYDKIHLQMLNEERKLNISKEFFLFIQDEIQPKDRDECIAFLFAMTAKWKYPSEICYNTIAYLNLLLSTKKVALKDLRLIAAVCFRLAAKVESSKQIKIDLLNEMMNENFTIDNVKSVELMVIEALSFKLSYPTVMSFMKRFLNLSGEPNHVVYFLAGIIVEKTTTIFDYITYFPSVIAASCVGAAFASVGNFEAARRVIADSRFEDKTILKKCLNNIIDIGRDIIKKLSHFNKEAPIVKVLEGVSFDFNVSLVI